MMNNAKKNGLGGKEESKATFKMFQPASRTFSQTQEDVPSTGLSDFEFINTAGAKSKVSPSARRAARVHVMRKYHSDKRKKNNPPAIAQPEQIITQPTMLPFRSPPSPETPQQHGAAFELIQGHPLDANHAKDLIRNGVLAPSSWNACLGCGRWRLLNENPLAPESSLSGFCTCMYLTIPSVLEPTPQTSFHIDPALITLLQFSISGVARGIVPMGLQSEIAWFTQAMSDPAFFHGTLLIGATFNALVRKHATMPSECLYHYNEAIKYTSANIEDSQNQLREGTVAAVACLAAFETAVNCNIISESVHIDGLEKVIGLRRSRQLHSLPDYLQKFISWVDTCHAVSNITRPRFLSIESNQTIPVNPTFDQEAAVKTSLEKKWGPEFPQTDVKTYEGMDASMTIIFHRLRQLSALATRYSAMKSNPFHQRQYTEGLLLLERQVIASVWSMSTNIRRQHSGGKEIRACARIWHSSILTYIHVFLRRTARSAWKVTIDKVAARVRYSLRILSPTEMWIDFPPKLLLWVLVIAGVAASDHPDKKWLIGLLSQLRKSQTWKTWDEVVVILREYAWMDEFCTEPCKAFFEESSFGLDKCKTHQDGILCTTMLPPDVLERCFSKCYPFV